jgi:hypothetical protein
MNTDMLLCKAKTLTGYESTGYVFSSRGRAFIVPSYIEVIGLCLTDIVGDIREIDPSTILLVAPAADKHGKRIFEWDKVRRDNTSLVYTVVQAKSGAWFIQNGDEQTGLIEYYLCDMVDQLELIEEPKP